MTVDSILPVATGNKSHNTAHSFLLALVFFLSCLPSTSLTRCTSHPTTAMGGHFSKLCPCFPKHRRRDRHNINRLPGRQAPQEVSSPLSSCSFQLGSPGSISTLNDNQGLSTTTIDNISLVIMAKPTSQAFRILSLPLQVQKKILGCLLQAHKLVILRRDTSTPIAYRTGLYPQILQVCSELYQAGRPILYGKNTFTTSTPSTSYDFDSHISDLSGKVRKLVTSVALLVDWPDQLWSKFPLIAQSLGELPLQKLAIIIVRKEELSEKEVQVKKERAALVGRATHRCALAEKEGISLAFEGKEAVANPVLDAERKMFKDLVQGLRTLREFYLQGFEDEGFAKALEKSVNGGRV